MYSSKVLIFLFILGYHLCQSQHRKFSWEMNNLWSSCSVTCGIGTSFKLTTCVRKTYYGTKELVDDIKCKASRKPSDSIVRSCFYGNCPIKDKDEYIWKVSEWSTCSKSCGGSGIRTRDVICALALRSGSLLEAPYLNCIANIEPNKSEMCAFNDCPPEFVTTPWAKCSKYRECRPGRRRRKLNCIVTLSNSKSIIVSRGHCYNRGKPPVEWEYCINDPLYQQKCEIKKKMEQLKVPIISTNTFIVHQMRNMNKLQLIVGQIAYILPHTFLVIKCQVKHDVVSNIKWIRNNMTYAYVGKVESRIFVTRRASLIIKKFQLVDEGFWYCKSKNVSANIQLFTKSPSEGYEEWVYRHFYNQEYIVKIKSDVNYIKAIYYQWIVSPWSICSQTCGEEGIQSRKVDCEKLETQYYLVVNENLCNDSRLQKPNNTRKCNGMKYCPQWEVLETPLSKCSDTCVGINVALQDTLVLCTLQDRVLPNSGCDQSQKPSPNCQNEKCDVYWKIGKWSKCSRSCGKVGLRSRTINCLWKNDNRSGGNLCYEKSLEVPAVISSCSPPPCNLECRDLSTFCGMKKYCWNNRYRFICCHTCYKN